MFGDTPAERNAKKAIVIQTLVYGSMIGGMCILTAHLPNVVVAALIEKQFGVRISYADWLRLQWPYLGMFALTQLAAMALHMGGVVSEIYPGSTWIRKFIAAIGALMVSGMVRLAESMVTQAHGVGG